MGDTHYDGCWQHHKDCAVAMATAALARNVALVGLLREVEWVWGECPICFRNKPTHAPDCKLAAALAKEGNDD